MTQLPEPNFIERNPDKITQEWINLYEQKSGKTLQPAQIERLMIDVGAYRETILRLDIQETAKQNLLSYANLENLLQRAAILRIFDKNTEMMKRMLYLLKEDGYKQASLSVQKQNYASKMYLKLGFEIAYENAEEYIMLISLRQISDL